MPKFSYVALDAAGKEKKGELEVASQNDAITALKNMGMYPTKIAPLAVKAGVAKSAKKSPARRGGKAGAKKGGFAFPGAGGKFTTKPLSIFTRQLATLQEAGLPLLRGLKVLEKQAVKPAHGKIIGQLASAVEGGATFSEALALHKKSFNKLYVNMVKAGEIGGVLELVLKRLAEFMEKAEKIKGKVVAAMFYPVAVLVVAVLILAILMVFVIPKFKEIFDDMLEGAALPAFTEIVLKISDAIRFRILYILAGGVGIWIAFIIFSKTKFGRYVLDLVSLKIPVTGPVLSKVAISRFTRTLGTLVSSGVPILQSLNIVKETAGNMVISNAVAGIHEAVKEGEPITRPLEAAKGGIFPPMVISMVEVGEQTGALPEMLLRIADQYDEEVDNAVAAMTSLIEPIMIVFLAVIVGSIVIAMFLPLIVMIEKLGGS